MVMLTVPLVCLVYATTTTAATSTFSFYMTGQYFPLTPHLVGCHKTELVELLH